MSAPAHPDTRSTPVRWFRWVALVEAVSYLLLLAATVAKRGFDIPGLVPVLGPIHGIVFLVYIGLLFVVRDELHWGIGRSLGVGALAAVPFGGFYVEKRML